MFVAVVLGNLVAALMCFCGLVNIFFLFKNGWGGGGDTFAMALACAAWPLAAGAGLYVLIQVAVLLEKQILQNAVRQGNGGGKPVYGKSHGHRMFGAAADALAKTVEATQETKEQEPHTVDVQEHTPRQHRTHVHDTGIARPVPPHAIRSFPSTPEPAQAPKSVEPGSFFHINPVPGPKEETEEKRIAPVPAAPQVPEESGQTAQDEPKQPEKDSQEAATPPPVPQSQPPQAPEEPKNPGLSFFRTN